MELQSFRNPEGSYGATDSEKLNTTGLAVLSQALVEANDSSAIAYLTAEQNYDGSWGQDAASADVTGLILYALLSAGIRNQTTTDAIDWLSRNQSPLGDWGTPEGTAWAILALNSDTTQPALTKSASSYLLAIQNPDGGFPRYESCTSEVAITGLVAWALLKSGAEFDDWNAAADYLESNRNGEAGWWRIEPAVIDTTTVLDTFALLNRSDSTTALAVLWILQRETPNTDFLARRMGTLARFGNPSETELAALLALQRADGGWGTDQRFASNVLDTVIVLDALHGADYFDTAILQQATQYLVTTQRADGSWGLMTTDDAGTIWATALAMQALKHSRKTFDLETTINAGTAYLESRQLGDGGWGEPGSSRVWESALAFIACMQTEFSTGAAEAGLQYLLDSQDGDGSWNQDPYDTALAMRALIESQPNLRIVDRDISFSSPGGVDGDEITISAIVHNSGGFAVDNAVVRFFLGDPHAGGIGIGPDQTIATLGPGASATVHQFWDTTGLGGDKNIFALVDPDDQIEEGNENDNKAVNRFRVSTKPDLIVTSISYLPENPQIGEEFDITVLVTNIGETAATGATLAFYRDSSNPPAIVGPSTIPAGLTQPYTITVSEGPGVVTYTAIADPDNTVAESNESNNQSAISVEVGERVDLMVNAVSFSRRDPAEGEVLELWAEIYNANVDGAANVVVVFTMDGTPGFVPDLARLTIPFIGGGQAITTERVQWQTLEQPGDHTAVVTVDPDNLIVETDELNNQQVGRFMVNALPDLIMGNEIITFHIGSSSSSPQTVVPRGTPVVLKAPLSNAGAQDAENVSFRFYLGDPNGAGVQIGDDLLVERIPYKSGPLSGTEPNDMQWLITVLTGTLDTSELDPGQYAIYGWIDPDDQILEQNTANNVGVSILEIGNEADLAVKSFSVSDQYPEEGDLLTVSGTIENLTETPANSYRIEVYDGNPQAGGLLIHEQPMSSLDGAEQDSFSFTWDTDLQRGAHSFYLLIDPNGNVHEVDESNNQTSTSFEVVAPSTPDLTVSRSDISFDPPKVATGETVTISAVVHNLRRLVVSNVAVRLLAVDPVNGEQPIGTDQMIGQLDGKGSALVQVVLDTSALNGSALIIVRVDPDDLIAERDEGNNNASTVLRLYLPDDARATDLTATVDLTDVYLDWNDPAAYPSIDGYDVQRDAELINPEWQEWARQSRASASSFWVSTQGSGFSDIDNLAASAVDGNPMTYWQAREMSEEWLALELPQLILLKAVTIAWGTIPGDYDLQIWNGFEWTTVLEVRGNQDRPAYHVLEDAVETDRIRIYIAEQSPQVKPSISELRVHSLRPVR